MIVLEGMDGSGKSQLAQRLSNHLNIPIHERASHSTNGPVDNLWEWVYNDVSEMASQPIAIYDRHPLISEYVYAPILRGSLRDEFHTEQARRLLKRWANNVFLIYCDPGIDEIYKNLTRLPDEQMKGVTENISELYYSYKALITYWPGSNPPAVWDYRLDNQVKFDRIKVLSSIQATYWS